MNGTNGRGRFAQSCAAWGAACGARWVKIARRRAHLLAAIVGLALFAGFAAEAQARIAGEALAGKPFGVARISLDLRPEETDPLRGFSLVEETGRAFYPAYQTGGLGETLGTVANIGAGILGPERPLGRILGRLGTDAPPAAINVYFLFKGDEPLKITVFTPAPQSIVLTPRPVPRLAYDRVLGLWWREYHGNAKAQAEAGDYPPLVETYLTSMLGHRLGLEPPPTARAAEKKSGELGETLELLFGVENLRMQAMRDSMARAPSPETGEFPLPDDIAWMPRPPLEPGAEAAVEPMALHVPEECFYVRFGTFQNFVWMNHLTDEYGGDLTRLLALRGHQDDSDLRTQQRMNLKDSAIGDLVGGALIADVAMIGRDTYTREGAAVGVLFQARNALLGAQFRQEREATLKEEKASGAVLETIKIGGKDVSFLWTPDNRLRSYYAVDGEFHLFTTSKAIVERFFEAGKGQGSLGKSPEFHQSRQLLPLDREDTIFVYFSSAFFRALVSPQYQIELARRVQSVVDMELVELARLAARGEGLPHETLEDLVEGGFLPRGFGRRADGSGPILTRSGVVDSLRGPRGAFTPIPDVEIRSVTREEAARYAARAAFYRNEWQQMDPLMIGIKRYALDRKGGEKIVVDAFVAPFVEKKYGWMTSILGEPTTLRVAPAPGDLVTVQAYLAGGMLAPLVPPHMLFLGLQDQAPLAAAPAAAGKFKMFETLPSAPGYLGGWPKPGFLDWLPLGLLAGEPDRFGFQRFPFGVWRRQWEDFSALSFDRDLLARVSPDLHPQETEIPAQLRLEIKDLTGAKLSEWVNQMYYERALKTSAGNTRLLLAMTDQLHVKNEDALTTAEKLLGVKLVCALGGEYRAAPDRGAAYWESTAWPKRGEKEASRALAEYRAPFLGWFRGGSGYLTKYGDKMVAHVEVDMQRKEPETKIELPLFNLFGGGKDAKKAEPKKPEPKPEELPPPRAPAKPPREF